jgi:YHS domain-containing protein
VLGWLLRLLFVFLLLRAAWRFLVGLVQGATGVRPGTAGAGGARGQGGAHGASGARAAGGQAVPLVKDPVCGTYVVRDRAITAGGDGATQFFCSDRCRDEWMANRAGRRSA